MYGGVIKNDINMCVKLVISKELQKATISSSVCLSVCLYVCPSVRPYATTHHPIGRILMEFDI